ncbi:MAG: MFS transporter [Planctomycetes bacterium]|nr:MFS transporter [Planctomycetota bacterium]
MRPVLGLYRDAFGGLPRLTWLLCAAAFLNRCGSMVVPFLGPYLKAEFGMSAADAGLVIGLYGVGAIFGSWLGGTLTDRLGPVRLQVGALAASATWMLLMTQCATLATLVPAVLVLGLLNDAFRPGSNTAVAQSAPPELRRKALSLNRFALNLGWACGPTIGGYLVELDFVWMFVADGATCALAAFWLAQVLRQWAPVAAAEPDVAAAEHVVAAARPASPWRDGHFVRLMVANTFVLLAFMQYFATGTRVFVDQGWGAAAVGWFLAVNPILITLFEMPVVHAMRARRPLPAVAVGALVIGLGYLCFLLPWGGPAIVLGMAIVAGGELLQMPMLGAHVNDIAPDRARGAYNGAYGVNFTFALVFAPALGGYVYDRLGADALWWSCAGMGSIGALLFAAEAARVRRRAAA